MKIFYLLPILLLISCKAVKVKELDFDTIPLAKSKIKEIHEIIITYDENGKVMYSDDLLLYYDSENKIIKEVGFIPNISDDVLFIYKNGLLVKKEYLHENYISYVEWKYDNKENVIEYKQVENNIEVFRKTITNDKKNNPIEEVYFHPKKDKFYNRFEYDYKKRRVKVISFEENNTNSNTGYVNNYFDKKGYIIKTEYVAAGDQKSTSFGFYVEYDSKRNILKNTSFDSNYMKTAFGEYKYLYDKKGNIIEKNHYINGNLIEKTTHEITYAEKN